MSLRLQDVDNDRSLGWPDSGVSYTTNQARLLPLRISNRELTRSDRRTTIILDSNTPQFLAEALRRLTVSLGATWQYSSLRSLGTTHIVR